MKKKRTSRRKRIEALALCAAMIFTFSADSIIRPYSVFAQEDESSEEEVEAEIKSDIMKIDYGSVEFWRWERVGKDNYPRDDEEHMSLFVFGDKNIVIENKQTASDNVIGLALSSVSPAMGVAWNLARNLTPGGIGDGVMFSAIAPNGLFIGPSADPITGVSGNNIISNADSDTYSKQFVNDDDPGWADYIREQYAHYIKLDNAYSAPYKYVQYGVDPTKDVFFTTSDMNPVYVKYKGVSEHVDGVDGRDAPIYSIRIKSNNKTKYYWWATDKGDESLPQIATDDKKSNWTFRSYNVASRGIVYVPVIFDKGNDDEVMATRDTGYVYTLDERDDGREEDKCKWFIGEYKHYSALIGNTKVGNGQILSISENDYIGAGGDDEASQNGVIIPNGSKVIVEKGGILAIEGNVINNGTIENRGGTILIKKGGSIFPFQQGASPTVNGCGTIKCVGGDIIIQEGGAIYAGLFDKNGALVPFYLDDSSTLINQGLLVYGNMRLGNGTRVELYENSRTYGSIGTERDMESIDYTIPANESNWFVKSRSGEMTLVNWLYMHRTRDDFIIEAYNKYVTENGFSENYINDTLIPKLDELAHESPNYTESDFNVEIYKTTSYPDPSSGSYTSDVDHLIKYAENMGYSYMGKDDKDALMFSFYGIECNFNDLLSINNTAFMTGALGSVKFLKESKGLKGMYIGENCVKTPTLLKVSSASLNDINKSSAIKVGELTL